MRACLLLHLRCRNPSHPPPSSSSAGPGLPPWPTLWWRYMMERWTAALCSLHSPVWCNCRRKASRFITERLKVLDKPDHLLTPLTLHLYAWEFTTLKGYFWLHPSPSPVLSFWSMPSLSLAGWLVGWLPKAAASLEFANGKPLKEPFMSYWETEHYSYLSREEKKKVYFCVNWRSLI